MFMHLWAMDFWVLTVGCHTPFYIFMIFHQKGSCITATTRSFNLGGGGGGGGGGGMDLTPKKFQFLEKGHNRNFDYKIVISVKKIQNLSFRSRMTKQIALLKSSREI